MFTETSKISMGRVFAAISFAMIILMCIASVVGAFYTVKIAIPQELLYVFLITMGYNGNSKVQTRIKSKEDAIHGVI